MPDARDINEPDRAPACPAYRQRANGYDEMCTGEGEVRSHWRYLVNALEGMGPQTLAQRQRDTVRMLRSDGATYNVYGTPDGLNRPWQLDPVPMLLGSSEWAGIEAGLAQRAELLNLILADIYGSRSLIRRGLIPADLVFGDPGFQRACVVPPPATPPGLSLYAADLVRSADGHFRVLKDRTQAPSGMGYALENRTVMSRLMPSLFRDSHPHRLAPFFRRMRESLAALAPAGVDDPRVVIMTPGPHNETYFEHIYLSNYLDYPLVEGADLTVRDGRVWLRSVSGLEPVDVIIRRIDDHYCDPLELRPDSLLGVPGLVEVARRGRVALANPLGAGILESPGLMAFLPQLAKQLLGQELRLPSVATWWCGQPAECDYVLANLPEPGVAADQPGHWQQGGIRRPAQDADWRHGVSGSGATTPVCRPGTAALSSAPSCATAAGTAPQHPANLPSRRAGQFRGHARRTDPVGAEPESRIVSNQAGASARTPGCWPRNPNRSIRCCHRAGRLPQCRKPCPASLPRTCSGWHAMPNGPRTMIRLIRSIHTRRNETLQLEIRPTRPRWRYCYAD